MRPSRKQSKNVKLRDVLEVTSLVSNLSLRGHSYWARLKREIQSLISRLKRIEIQFFGFEYNLRCYRDTKTAKTLLTV